jgi:phytoene dehydrogenase-like protein
MAEIARSTDAAWNGRHDDEPPLILAQPSLFDDSRAPGGGHTAWAYCRVPNGSTRDMTEAIEPQVERFAPGFGETVLRRHTMNTAQLEARNPTSSAGTSTAERRTSTSLSRDRWRAPIRTGPRSRVSTFAPPPRHPVGRYTACQ